MNLTRRLDRNMPESKFLRSFPLALKNCLLLCLTCCALGAQAQGLVDNPDWQETEVPAPPKFDPKQLVNIDMPAYVSMKFGVDPATVVVTPDGIVRYVIVAVSPSGSVNAFFEGIRCAKGEVKAYARASATGVWTLVKEPEWRGLNDKQPSKHALALARQGVCEGNTAAGSATEIIRRLKSR
ncbi:CNP1-like family protein [Rhodoferax sp.]|uniref:CNP1-like family protein n=1 Tax=Rhodoferax sp. TaxID=50421 RepID=UPI002730B053|nr:CNP1-like family protein [Rhodoferax sp.]MDP1528754.1 CNP1-like family protein [Rhodoferax sp.]MDP1943761.1 CNP1-like family protein [Rhodoferax sp.]MDP2441829.1 CNP1-like family protein [Rhodoferax sp.]MDZ4208155.1 CNP1-like family protein [Rhodoferax sp.]